MTAAAVTASDSDGPLPSSPNADSAHRRYLVTAFLFVALAFVNWRAILVWQEHQPNGARNTPGRAYVEARQKQYEAAAQEIRLRLEHEHTLFLYQFVIVGAVVGFLIKEAWGPAGKQTELRPRAIIAAALLAVPLLAVDMHILYNSKIICELGTWVRNYYEGAGGWEEFLGTHDATFHAWRLFPMASALLLLPTVLTLSVYYALLFRLRDEETTVIGSEGAPTRGAPSGALHRLHKVLLPIIQLQIVALGVINYGPLEGWDLMALLALLIGYGAIVYRGGTRVLAQLDDRAEPASWRDALTTFRHWVEDVRSNARLWAPSIVVFMVTIILFVVWRFSAG